MGGPLFPWLLLLGFFVVVALEMFLPSAGTLLVASVCLAVAAIWLAFLQSMWTGVTMSLIIFGSIPFLIATFVYVWPHTPLGRRFIMNAPDADNVLPDSMKNNPLHNLKGERGTVTIAMLPTGEVRIGKKRYNATCQSGSAEVGVEVRVVEVRMGRLYVLPADVIDDPATDGGFEESLEKTVENTSFEDFSWDEEEPSGN